jgi:hypothetical protein
MGRRSGHQRPRGIVRVRRARHPHTFTVSSETARYLLVTEPGDFDAFVRALSEPATEVVIPAPSTEPPDVATLGEVAARYGIEILGPPGIPA